MALYRTLRQVVPLARRVCAPAATAAPSIAVPATSASTAHAAAAHTEAGTTFGAGAVVSYEGRERLLAYGNAGKAEKIRRRLAILEQEARELIKEFDESVEGDNARRQDIYYTLWTFVDERIQLLQSEPEEYERK
ncbi:hypothetical protein ABPG75_008548 [Micractinium tetrahymenae]